MDDRGHTRLADRRYLYQSRTFHAELDVDDLGLVVTYPGIWKRDGVDGTNGQPEPD